MEGKVKRLPPTSTMVSLMIAHVLTNRALCPEGAPELPGDHGVGLRGHGRLSHDRDREVVVVMLRHVNYRNESYLLFVSLG